MRVGMPIISTNVGGISEAVQDGVTGFLVDVDNVTAMREKILLFFRDRERIRVMGEAGRQVFLEKFTIEKMITLYESTLGLDVDSLRSSLAK
jgi:glycosyltransferase involved in cell wall biosynthesis